MLSSKILKLLLQEDEWLREDERLLNTEVSTHSTIEDEN